ncbi:MAG: transketolase family protein [Oscillospiraceae bacterium]|nr:transketolase family protein [Oscillospiraceae bacterium]
MTRQILAKEHGADSVFMRDAFCTALMELAEKDERIVLLDADLMGAMGTKPFQKRYPSRTVDCGVQEANMIGVACGLAVQGKIPFAHTFAPFCTRRACDQIFISGAYNHANVKVIGSDPGITATYNGGTHMPFEDMGIMRGIPGVTVVEPADIVMLRSLLPQIAEMDGLVYMRLVRKEVKKIYEDGSTFKLGEAAVFSEGRDVTIIASGFCVSEALSAASLLEAQGISAGVIDMFTWKPIDEAAILRAVETTGAIVTAENHNIMHGLGCAVSEVLTKRCPAPLEMVGVQDEFGEVGPVSYLRERYGLTDTAIVQAALRAIARKT